MDTPDRNAAARERRRARRRRQVRIRRTVAVAVLLALAAGIALGARAVGGGKDAPAPAAKSHQPAARAHSTPPVPDQIRGVHVTMALASLPGKLRQYLVTPGLNAIELDVKDENGRVGFERPRIPLAHQIGASAPYYDAKRVVRLAHKHGIYLIGRVVTFEDPVLSAKRPDLAVHRSDGSLWLNNSGLGWTNPYDRRVWRYDVDIAAAAAKAGFDEIQFDYVRFPSDGDLSIIRYPGAHPQPMKATIAAFLRYAAARLHPLGVRVSVDVFGLAATHDLGIGQYPAQVGRVVDAIYPMTYPSHYRSGEFNIPDPNAAPGATVRDSLRDFRTQLDGRKALLVPWLQDFSLGRTYSFTDVAAQIAAARALDTGGFMLWNASGLYTPRALHRGSSPPLPELPAPQL